VYPTSISGRPVLPDVRMSIPMDTLRCVEKIKEALDINGVYSVHCDIPTQTVTVSGNVAPQALLKRAKHVKRKAKMLSYTNHYTDDSNHHGRISSSAATYGTMSGAPKYDSSYYYRSASPPRDHQLAYYNRNNYHSFGGYNDQYRPSHNHRYTHYY
jgi:copper chaperone CopZ